MSFTALRVWPSRVRALFTKHRRDGELNDEIQSHLDRLAEEHVRRGLSAVEARAAARREFGGTEQMKETYRDQRGLPFFDSLAQDLRYAARTLLKNPGFTAVTVATLALGIGANTAVFSAVNTVLLKPLTYRDADRIVTLSSLWTKTGAHGQVSAPDFHDWHDQSTAFDAMAYYAYVQTGVMAGPTAEYAVVAGVTPEFFRALGVEAVVGRLFGADEVGPNSAGAVVISHAYWRSHFGVDASVSGQTVRLVGRTLPIVGVLPRGFHFPDRTDVWFPANTILPETTSRGAHNYRVVARLKSGVSLAQTQAQMAAIGTRLEQQFPPTNRGKSVAVTRIGDEMVANVRLTLYVLLGAVGVVLLIACTNVANLLLAKGTVRGREIAVRSAIGASRSRIVRQLITESLFLALTAGGVGLIMAIWGSQALVALAPSDVPRLAEAGLDTRVLAFTLGISVIAMVLSGVAPALHVSRVDTNRMLKQGGTRAGVSGRAGRMRGALVVTEIALSAVLLVGAGLLIRSFVALNSVALGFRPEQVLVMETSVPASSFDDARRATRFYETLLAEIAALPGVSMAGATRIPPGRVGSNGAYSIDHVPAPEDLNVNSPEAVFSVVTPGAFATLGIPLTRGRDFDGTDTYDAPFTVIVNEALARQAFPGKDPLGHVLVCGFDSLKPMTIVGVVGNVRQYGPARDPSPEIYMPYQQHPRPSTALSVLVRTATDPTSVSEAMRRATNRLSPNVPVKFTTMTASVADNVAAPRFRTLLLTIFAGLAVCLAMAGVYGVMAYVVGERTTEIGLRMALGASRGSVLRLLLSRGLAIAGAGLALGVAGSVVTTRILASFLFEVKPSDPMTYVAAAVLLGAVALLASYVPAWRATRVEPMVVLRHE